MELKKIVLLLWKLLPFEIPCSIFDIQIARQVQPFRLKGEGSKPGDVVA
jgi:hypothetical protein